MKSIYILGSGGFAKEVFWLIHDINKEVHRFDFKGFIDYDPEVVSIRLGGVDYPIFNEDEWLNTVGASLQNLCLAIGIGNPATIRKVSQKMNHFEFPNLIHPSFKGFRDGLTFGRGNIITAGCIFTIDIQVGSFNIFNLNTTVGHDAVIGNGNVINPGCNISGGVRIGDFNLLGTNSTILQNVTVGDFSVLGASSLANKAIDSNKVAVGVPAKVIKDNA